MRPYPIMPKKKSLAIILCDTDCHPISFQSLYDIIYARLISIVNHREMPWWIENLLDVLNCELCIVVVKLRKIINCSTVYLLACPVPMCRYAYIPRSLTSFNWFVQFDRERLSSLPPLVA